MICNNISQTHNLININDSDALRVLCIQCKKQFVIRKDSYIGAPEKRQYIKLFKRDALQGNDNLLYKYHPEFLKV